MYEGGKKKRTKLRNQSMGYKGEVQHFVEVVSGKVEPKLTHEEIFNSTRVVLCAHDSLDTEQFQEVKISF